MGKLVEIYGGDASGKTTLALSAIAQSQRNGRRSALLELEYKLSNTWVRKSKVDPDKTLLLRCSEAAPALKATLELIHSGEFGLVVIDSLAALLPFADIVEMDSSGEIERLLERALPLIASEASKTNTCVLLLNQMRIDGEKVFGDRVMTPGGHVLRHTCSIRIELTKKLAIKSNASTVIGSLSQATIKKNSLAAPYQVADLAITHDRALDQIYEVVVLGKKWGIFNRDKSFIEYRGANLGNTDQAAYEFLLDNPDLANDLLSRAYAVAHDRINDRI